MTLVPAVLVLIVGSELIRTSIDRWFNAPMDEILSSANQIASDYYQRAPDARQRSRRAASRATLAAVDLDRRRRPADSRSARAGRHAAARADGRRSTASGRRAGRCRRSSRSSTSRRRQLPPGYSRAAADRLAAQALGGSAETRSIETLGTSGDLLHAAAVIRVAGTAAPTGVVVATDYLTGDLAARSRRMTQAFESYNQLRVLQAAADRRVPVVLPDGDAADSRRRHLDGLVPGQADHAAGADAGGGRARDRRRAASISASSRRATTSSASLVEAFNAMAGELADEPPQGRPLDDRARAQAPRGRRPAPLHRNDSRAHHDRRRLGRRRRRDHHDQQRGGAAAQPRSRTIVGQPARAVFDRARSPAARRRCSPGAGRGRGRAGRAGDRASRATARSCTWRRSRRALVGDSGAPEGVVLVLDDVTPLIRAQKVAAWREVARRLAHEIKNPLTPIQLSAERLRRHFAGAPPQAQGARRRVHDDDRRRGRIAEGAGRRVLAVRADAVAADGADRSRAAHHRHARALQRHLHRRRASSSGSRRACRSSASTRSRSAASSSTSSTTRSRRWSAAARSSSRRSSTRPTASSASIVADDGPGIPPAEREKLFLPYYSTKRRGSGLGLAIVRRIIAEHGGSIDVGDNTPRGTRFTIELPC